MVTAPRILVVDDAEDTREMYAEILRYNGFEVHCAGDGDEALKLAAAKSPVLIVLDLVMPRLPGDEVMRRLKACPKTSDIIVVMLTGHGDEQLMAELRKLGATDICMKPLLPNELVDKVRTHLQSV